MDYTGRDWLLTAPPGMRLLTSNDRGHWAAGAKATADLRDAFGWLARSRRIPELRAAHVLYYIRARGRFDPANWMPTAKAAIDGIVDAGVLPDDSRRYLVGPDPREGERPGFSLLIRELAGPPPQC